MSEDGRSDQELLDAWRKGDRRAANLLFDRHYPAVYAFFANTSTGNRDDLVQQTFLACVEGRDRLREDGAFRGYMLTIAKRVLYRSFRARADAERFDPAVSSLHDLDPSPSQLVVRRHELQLLVEGLRRIAIDQQIALELYHLHGYRAPELAAILEVPEGTVRSRLTRGIEALRDRVRELDTGKERSPSSPAEIEAALAELGRLLAEPHLAVADAPDPGAPR